ncbi:hypothetical protein GGR51DRAFT_572152 [Nemania sp. FL0031]|nr:hypothetical protein GGR51DRAFT_572152 [Nemania sp. FL0031]
MQSNNNPNDIPYSLDHLIVGVRKTTLSEATADYALNHFITDTGRQTKKPAPDHYSYNELHNRLVADHGLNENHVIHVHGEEASAAGPAGFYGRLGKTKDEHNYVTHAKYKLPYVEFEAKDPVNDWNDDDIFSSTPIGKRLLPQPLVPENTPPTPAPQPPVDPPVNRRITNLDRPNPGTPRRKPQVPVNPQTPANPPRVPQGPVGDPDSSDEDNEKVDPELGGVLDPDEREEQDENEGSMLESLAPTIRQPGTDDEGWRSTCEFFNCPQDVLKVKVNGIKLELERYQAFAVWRIFEQIGDRKIPSFMLGDEPGLGKTGTAITTAVIFAILNKRFIDVTKEWNGKGLDGPRQHLPRPTGDASSSRQRCPSQKKEDVLCPCSGLSYRVVSALNDLPTLICCPANVMEQWYKEIAIWVDRSPASPAKEINALVFAGRAGTKDHPPFRPSGYWATKRGSKLAGKAGLSSTFFIFSYQNADGFREYFKDTFALDKQPSNRRQPSKRRQPGRGGKGVDTSVTNRLGCGFMFFDEYHQYKGSRGHRTEPFKTLLHVRESCVKPVMAVGLSGSLCQGPDYWRPFIEHVFGYPPEGGRRAKPREIAGLKSTGDLDKYENDFRFLVDNLDRDTPARTTRSRGRGIDTRKTNLTAFITNFIPLMILARKKTHEFRGVRIGTAATAIRIIRKDMLPGEALQAVQDMSAKVGTFMKLTFQRELDNWTNGGEQGEKPTLAGFIRNMITRDTVFNALGNRLEGEREREGRHEYDILTRASCFPYITVLSRSGVEHEQFLVRGFELIATRLSNAIHPQRLDNLDVDAVMGIFAESPFYEHRNRLLAESPKIRWVQEYINQLLWIRGQDRGSPEVNRKWGPPPPDSSNNRHALVVADNPLSAFLTIMILWELFRQQIRGGEIIFLYAHSGVSFPHREAYQNYLNRKCDANDRLIIMISTISIFGVGLNLQRANTAILTEVPSSYEDQKQVFGRVDRKGQMMTPFLYQLYDAQNIAERIRKVRNKNRRQIASQGRQSQEDQVEHEVLCGELATLTGGEN